MKINYKNQEVSVYLAVGRSNGGTAVSVRYSSDLPDQDGSHVERTIGSKVFTTETCGQAGLDFVSSLQSLVQALADSSE